MSNDNYKPPHLRNIKPNDAPSVRLVFQKSNERGFFGDLKKSSRIERYIFGKIDNTAIDFDEYNNIPIKVDGRNSPQAIEVFDDVELPEQLKETLKKMQYTQPTPIQKHCIPVGMQSRDIMACAQTGSGKTAAFLIPVISNLIRTGGNNKHNQPQALILAPTRELANQIYKEATKFCYGTGIATTVIYGGISIQNQIKELDRGADIIIATPGRLIDLLSKKKLYLNALEYLVMDEADRMLDMGFEPQIREIMERYDVPLECTTFMFSATFPQNIQDLASKFLDDFIFISIGKIGLIPNDVELVFEWVDMHKKQERLLQLLSEIEFGLVLIFVETKREADYLDEQLHLEGFPCTSIHGDKTQMERQDALFSFRSGRNPILIATDVAARGLDVKGITHVINYELPSNIDSFIHRIGRTGRIGGHGIAINFYNQSTKNLSTALVKLLIDTENEVPERLLQMTKSRQRANSYSESSAPRYIKNQSNRGMDNNPISSSWKGSSWKGSSSWKDSGWKDSGWKESGWKESGWKGSSNWDKDS